MWHEEKLSLHQLLSDFDSEALSFPVTRPRCHVGTPPFDEKWSHAAVDEGSLEGPGKQERWGRILGVFSFCSVVQTNWDEFLTLGRRWGWATFQRLDLTSQITLSSFLRHLFLLLQLLFAFMSSVWYLRLFHVVCPAFGLVHVVISWEHSDQWRNRTTSRSNYHISVSLHTHAHTHTEHQVPLMQKSTACHTEQFRSNFRTWRSLRSAQNEEAPDGKNIPEPQDFFSIEPKTAVA